MEEAGRFDGLVVVCDLDDFKQLNDRFGHLVGDEILHGVGKLIGRFHPRGGFSRSGGAETNSSSFSIVKDRAHPRPPAGIEDRLRHFQLRQHGIVPVHFSWGITSTADRKLRESLEEADRLNVRAEARPPHLAAARRNEVIPGAGPLLEVWCGLGTAAPSLRGEDAP